MAEFAFEQPGHDFGSARGRAPHIDQPEPRPRQHPAKKRDEHFISAEHGEKGGGSVNDDRGEHRHDQGPDGKGFSQAEPRGDEQRQVYQQDHGTDRGPP